MFLGPRARYPHGRYVLHIWYLLPSRFDERDWVSCVYQGKFWAEAKCLAFIYIDPDLIRSLNSKRRSCSHGASGLSFTTFQSFVFHSEHGQFSLGLKMKRRNTDKFFSGSCWYPVVSPTSCLANDPFANVLGRYANVLNHFANALLVNSPTS